MASKAVSSPNVRPAERPLKTAEAAVCLTGWKQDFLLLLLWPEAATVLKIYKVLEFQTSHTVIEVYV